MTDNKQPELKAISENLKNQDNRATEIPIFLVQKKRRYYGCDASGDYVWLDGEGEEADEIKSEELDEQSIQDFKEPEGWTKVGYYDAWEFVTSCFTEQGCKDYLEVNGHNLGETRIYVESGWRNREWQTVRNWLMNPTPTEREKKLEEALRWAITALEGTNVPVFNSRKYNAARAALEGEG